MQGFLFESCTTHDKNTIVLEGSGKPLLKFHCSKKLEACPSCLLSLGSSTASIEYNFKNYLIDDTFVCLYLLVSVQAEILASAILLCAFNRFDNLLFCLIVHCTPV